MSIIKTLSDYGQQIVRGIQNNLDAKGLTNTGKTKQSLKWVVEDKGDKIILTVSGAANIITLEFGASPIKKKTTGDYIESMTKWGQSKLGLSLKEAKGLGFAMLKKRLGDGIGGRTTKADGSYFVPNSFNKGGVITDTVNDSLLAQINRDVLKSATIDYIELAKKQFEDVNS